jgi:hypothetical protein
MVLVEVDNEVRKMVLRTQRDLVIWTIGLQGAERRMEVCADTSSQRKTDSVHEDTSGREGRHGTKGDGR